jgi:hypothetical protein
MARRFPLSVLVVALSCVSAQAQFGFGGAGSTPQGDYLRGVGCAAAGMGLYNERTAVANQTNANTMILLNEYMASVAKQESLEYAAHRRAVRESIAENRKRIDDRIRNNPEALDVTNGDALNVKLWELLDPKVSDSASRYAEIPLDADFIRHIPFKLAEKGETFSMSRLSLKGKKKWAVAFQDPRFAAACRAYQRTVDNALELATDGKMNDAAILAIENAVADLNAALLATPHLLDPEHNAEAGEARAQLDNLQKTARLFMRLQIQQVLGDIDNYHGTTVDDFRLFMRRHKLVFARAETPDERTLYPQLYTALIEQHKKVIAPEDSSAK